MALPSSGAISFSQLNTERGQSATAAVSLNDSGVRTLAGVASGAISMSNLHGKAWAFMANIAGGTNVNLRTAADAAGYDGRLNVQLTLTSAAVASATSLPALDLGTWPAGTALELTINTAVTGYGGAGGAGGYQRSGYPGAAGGPAMKANAITSGSITITLGASGAVRGGGGGGGGGSTYMAQEGTTYYTGGAGGRGQGAQGAATAGSAPTNAGNGGNGGGYGTAGISGTADDYAGGAGGAGGAALVNSSLCTLVSWTGKYSGALA